METKRSKWYGVKSNLFASVFVLLFFSCHSQSYIDLLTGGGIKYWSFCGNYTSYLSFNKQTHRIFYYADDLEVSYSNGAEYLAKGKYFRIEGDEIFRSWALTKDTIPIDTIRIVAISRKYLVLHMRPSSYPVTLRHYPNPQKRCAWNYEKSQKN